MLEQNKQKISQPLDLKGLACPLPLLKMKLALRQLEPGQQLTVETTDSGSWTDFHKFAELTENELVRADVIGAENAVDCYRFIIKKGL